MPGKFIVIDGPDGAGTTTHTKMLCEQLQKEGLNVAITAEPTDGPIGAWIRQLLRNGTSINPLALQLLFCADRSWHVSTVIEPAYFEGKIVISDRYTYSTMVYAKAQGIDTRELQALNDKFMKPDCVIFTLPPLEVALKRMEKRTERDIFEEEQLQRKIHEEYTALAKIDPSIQIVDSSKTKQETGQEIYTIVQRVLKSTV